MISCYRLTKGANKFEGDLEVLRKAIGFGDYGKFDGDLDFYTYETFRDCEFGSTQPIATVAPLTTTQQPETDAPEETTASPVEETTTVASTTVPSTTERSTTEEFIIGPIDVTTETPLTNLESRKRKRRAGKCTQPALVVF